MEENLESMQTSEEQAKQVSEAESAEQVSKEEAKVSGEVADEVRAKILEEFKQSEDFVKAVQSEKDKSIYEEIQKHTKPLKDQIKELTRAAKEAEIRARENTILETFGDTDEAKKMAAYERKLWERDLELSEKEAAHAELLQRAAETNRRNIIQSVVAEFKDEGVTAEDLEGVDVSKAEDSAQAKTILQQAAKSIAYDKLIAELDKKPPQKIDSGVESGGGQSYTTVSFDENAPSAREMISKGVNKK